MNKWAGVLRQINLNQCLFYQRSEGSKAYPVCILAPPSHHEANYGRSENSKETRFYALKSSIR